MENPVEYEDFEQDNKELLRAYNLGVEAEVFLSSEIGKEIIRKCQEDIRKWRIRMIDLDPYSEKAKYDEARVNTLAAMRIIDYFNEILSASESAAGTLDDTHPWGDDAPLDDVGGY